MSYSTHSDTFAKDNLPSKGQWPRFVFTLPELNYPDILNCAEHILDKHITDGKGDKIAIYSDTATLTYKDLFDEANKIANVLIEELGLKPGNRVLLRSANSARMIATWFGVIKAGGIVVATMPMLRSAELSVIIDKAEISLALCDAPLLEELQHAQTSSSLLKRIVPWGAGQELDTLMAAQPATFDAVQTASDDVCLLAFTSGTTGNPKACAHFHRDVMAMMDTFARYTLKPEKDDIFLGTPPFAFTFGLGASVVFPLGLGLSTAIAEKPGYDNLCDVIAKYRVTTLFTAPTAYRALINMYDDYDLSSITTCVSAGEHLPQATSDDWHDKTGIRIIDGIGSTEMIHIFISASGDDIRPGSTGKPIPGFEACVLDENNDPLPEGNTGRLAVRGPTGCKYLNDSRQEAYVINGWNVTGDVYRVDEDGYFWFVSRADDMIISSGYNIAGPEVEQALLKHDAVSECAVIGVDDAERGQIVKAYAVLNDGFTANDDLVETLQTFTKETIAPYKYPRAIAFIDELPKTQTGKIQRFKLRSEAT